MRSESPSALGQPSETNPILGAMFIYCCGSELAREAVEFIVGASLPANHGIREQARSHASGLVALVLLLRRGLSGKAGERKTGKHVLGLILQLLLHLHEHILALI